MTEPRNPLEVVEEALALVEWEGEFVPDGDGVNIPTCPVCGHHPAEGHAKSCDVRAALALVRKMRADAVVGWVDWTAKELAKVLRDGGFFHVYPNDNGRSYPALLLPLPDSTEAVDE
jgi:hypothetical protein